MNAAKHWHADAYIVSATVLAALGWIFSKEVLIGMPPLLFLGTRFLIAALLLMPLAWAALRQLSSQAWLRILGVGLVFSLGMMLWVFGLAHSQHMGVGAFLNSLTVVLVPIVALAFGEKPKRMIWLALPVALSGMACLFLENHFAISLGEWSYLAAASVFALHFNLNSHAAARLPLLALTAVQLAIVGLASLAVSAATETWQLAPAASVNLWVWFTFSILIATCVRFVLQIKGQGLAPASHVGLIMSLEPVWVAFIAAAWYDESMSTLQIFGCCLIFSAVLISRWRSLWQLLTTWRDREVAVID